MDTWVSAPGCPVPVPQAVPVKTSALILLIAIGLGSCRSVPLPQSTIDVDTAATRPDWNGFTLGPNDLVYFALLGQGELELPESGLRISPDGTLSLPLVGSVPVAGKSVEEARKAIEAGFQSYYHEPAVMLSVIELSSRRFYILGDVTKPGPVPMDRPLGALEALSFGGSFLPGANRKHVSILRRHGDEDVEVLRFNARKPGADGLVQVQPNDVIFVSKSGVGVFSESVMPYLQGLGYSISQLAALAIAYENVND